MDKDPGTDPCALLARVITKVKTEWMRHTYPFAALGARVSLHYSSDILRRMSPSISIGNDVYVGPDVWLNVAPGSTEPISKIVLGKGCKIGRRSTISSRNQIILEADVLLAPSVLIMDHNHEFSNIESPIHAQGVTTGGTVSIGRNCWLGHGAVVVSNGGDLVVGRNSVIGANSVVTRSFPAFSVIAGNPARLIRTSIDNREHGSRHRCIASGPHWTNVTVHARLDHEVFPRFGGMASRRECVAEAHGWASAVALNRRADLGAILYSRDYCRLARSEPWPLSFLLPR